MKRRIIEELEALASHYIRPVRSTSEHERFLADYLNDLSGFPIEAVMKACQDWRKSDASKFPTCGQLLAFVRNAMPKGSAVNNEAWRHLTDQEYDALTMAEKIRHRTIMAVEAKTKAGPMWRNGKPVSPEDMPESWHTQQAIARGHYEEASRLKAKLAEYRSVPV